MCNCRLTVELFGQPGIVVYNTEAHLDDHMVWLWRELIVRAVVPRRYHAPNFDRKETIQDIIRHIRKHDRSSLIYDSIHGKPIFIHSTTSSYSIFRHSDRWMAWMG